MAGMSAQDIANRVELIRVRNTERDAANVKLMAIRRGDYESVAPGLFNTAEFDKPLVANLIDTTARDIAETMAPLPSFNCQSAVLSNDSDQKRQEKRSAIANWYVQNSRLQDQLFEGADRYGSFGFMAYIAEPDFKDQAPVIRVDDVPTAYYTHDYRGRVKQYFVTYMVSARELSLQFPEVDGVNLDSLIKQRYGDSQPDRMLTVARWYDDDCQCLVLLDPVVMLVNIPNKLGKCPVRVVERPTVTGEVRGQFDDVIWVQIARALIQMYTLNAIEQSVNAPLAIPRDADQFEIGPNAVIQTDNPGQVGRVNLQIPAGLFPEGQQLAQEQRMGSRYPEGRAGSTNASIITGQGMQALMGTFDTQVSTFQRLNSTALEDIIALCFEMDEAYWPDAKKTIRVREAGAPRKLDYVSTKDINGDYSIDVSYGAVAGLDPNRALIFVLQALGGGLMSKYTAMRTLPVELNVAAEERQMQLEQMDASIAATLAALPQAIPQMAMQGADPREIVMQVAELRTLMGKGVSPADAIQQVLAPKQTPEEAQAAAQPPSPLDQAQGAGAGPAALPGAGTGGGSDMMMMLAGLNRSGNPDLRANVSRMLPAQGSPPQ